MNTGYVSSSTSESPQKVNIIHSGKNFSIVTHVDSEKPSMIVANNTITEAASLAPTLPKTKYTFVYIAEINTCVIFPLITLNLCNHFSDSPTQIMTKILNDYPHQSIINLPIEIRIMYLAAFSLYIKGVSPSTLKKLMPIHLNRGNSMMFTPTLISKMTIIDYNDFHTHDDLLKHIRYLLDIPPSKVRNPMKKERPIRAPRRRSSSYLWQIQINGKAYYEPFCRFVTELSAIDKCLKHLLECRKALTRVKLFNSYGCRMILHNHFLVKIVYKILPELITLSKKFIKLQAYKKLSIYNLSQEDKYNIDREISSELREVFQIMSNLKNYVTQLSKEHTSFKYSESFFSKAGKKHLTVINKVLQRGFINNVSLGRNCIVHDNTEIIYDLDKDKIVYQRGTQKRNYPNIETTLKKFIEDGQNSLMNLQNNLTALVSNCFNFTDSIEEIRVYPLKKRHQCQL